MQKLRLSCFSGLVFCFFLVPSMQAQEINNYKYVVVPLKYDFLKSENQYRLNTLTKFLFEKYNFNTVYQNNIPQDLAQNGCNGLKAELQDNSNLFTTKLQVLLKDCNNRLVFISTEGQSRIKEFEPAFHEALKKAFVSVKKLNYEYQPIENETQNMSKKRNKPPVTVTETDRNPPINISVGEDVVRPAKKSIKKGGAPIQKVYPLTGLLYAQPTAQGYQLVDKTPKVVMQLQKTGKPNVFIARKDAQKGVVFLNEGQWFFNHYKDDTLLQEVLNIKF